MRRKSTVLWRSLCELGSTHSPLLPTPSVDRTYTLDRSVRVIVSRICDFGAPELRGATTGNYGSSLGGTQADRAVRSNVTGPQLSSWVSGPLPRDMTWTPPKTIIADIILFSPLTVRIFTARHYASAVYAVVACPSVRPFVCH